MMMLVYRDWTTHGPLSFIFEDNILLKDKPRTNTLEDQAIGQFKLFLPYTDPRYLGCYNDNDGSPDLSFLVWKKSEGKPAHECVDECTILGYKYAGVKNGGACYCGNDFGNHGEANETECDVRCVTYGAENCGGVETNAIYMTELGNEHLHIWSVLSMLNHQIVKKNKVYNMRSNINPYHQFLQRDKPDFMTILLERLFAVFSYFH